MLSYLTLAVKHTCSYSLLSHAFPDVKISIWCKDTYDILILKKGKDDFSKIKKFIEKNIGKVEKIYVMGMTAQIVLSECYCFDPPIFSHYPEYHNVDIPPVIYQNGKELTRMIIMTEEIDQFIDKLIDKNPQLNVEIISSIHIKKIELDFPFYISQSEIIKDLTKKQLQALILAFESGYYRIPRDHTIQAIASGQNIHRKTFEEHLRKAENKIMKNIIPTLLLSNINQ